MKKLMKKYGHVWILSYGLIYLPWFAALQQNVGKPYHVMHTALDDLIPFNEYFIVPYLLWFLYVAAAIAYFFFTNKDDYYRLCTFLFTGMTISLLVCTLYPNGTDFRPAINPDKGIGSAFHQFLQGNGRRGTADAGGGNADLFTIQVSRIRHVFPAVGHQLRTLKVFRDLFTALGVSRKDHIASHIAGSYI